MEKAAEACNSRQFDGVTMIADEVGSNSQPQVNDKGIRWFYAADKHGNAKKCMYGFDRSIDSVIQHRVQMECQHR
jgi:hypothetical protein